MIESLVPRKMPKTYIHSPPPGLSPIADSPRSDDSDILGEDTEQEPTSSHFDGLLLREDGQLFQHLSRIPSQASRIRSVKFSMARADQSVNREPLPSTMGMVADALKRLPILESVSLTCAWEKHMEAGDHSFEESPLARAGNEMFKPQQIILEALRQRNLPLKSLTLEPFRAQCVLALSSLDDKVSTVFKSVAELTLKLDDEVTTFRPDYVDYFISLMPNIRHLTIHAWPVQGEASGIGFLPKKKLEYLETVDFSGLMLKYGALTKFFSDHGSTIKQARLANLFLLSGPADKINLGRHKGHNYFDVRPVDLELYSH